MLRIRIRAVYCAIHFSKVRLVTICFICLVAVVDSVHYIRKVTFLCLAFKLGNLLRKMATYPATLGAANDVP